MARTGAQTKTKNGNGKTFTTQQSLNDYIWSICDILRRSNCASALQYIPELTWILFLRILDEKETLDQERAEAVGASFQTSIESPYRWQDWATPDGWKRKKLTEDGTLGQFFKFVNGKLIPYLKKLKDQPNATPRQKVISQILSGVERTRIDTERNMLEVLDRVDAINRANIDPTHMFPLSQAYEGLLLKLGEKNNDGGQFFTPRVIIRAMINTVQPHLGQTVYDPGNGTGGMLAQAYEYIFSHVDQSLSPDQIDQLRHRTFYGREKEDLIYPIALANLVLHDIDQPNIWHGNTLTGQEVYGGLFEGAPALFDVIFTNPPFGGKEGGDAKTKFAFKTGATQVLFLQHVIDNLTPTGECGIVLDEGVLFRTNETAFVQTKRKLLDACDLYCIVSMPAGVFAAVGAGVKTNLLFFKKGTRTEKIWYYDLSDIKVTKKSPLTDDHFKEYYRLLPDRADSDHSWTIDIVARRAAAQREAEPFETEAAKATGAANVIREKMKSIEEQIRLAGKKKEAKRVKELKADWLALKKDSAFFDLQAREAKAKAEAIKNAVYDLKAVNPHAKNDADTRTPEELIAIIEAKGHEVIEALKALQK
jgi:type I restriction enzyme M protein